MGRKRISDGLWVLWDVTVFPLQGSCPEILRMMQGTNGIGASLWSLKPGLRRHQDLKQRLKKGDSGYKAVGNCGGHLAFCF